MVRLGFLIFLLIYAGRSESNSFQIVPSAKDEGIFFHEVDCQGIGEEFAIVVHGWRGSCSANTTWVLDLMSNLTVHRGGCLICMDYSKYSKLDYFRELVPKFDHIANVLTEKLRDLELVGFEPKNGFMFGFSFGAHLAIEAGRRFGLSKFGRIDACDPAGPEFDNRNFSFSLLDPKLSAHKVQCIFTSRLGTKRRACHQNWHMGNCGLGEPSGDVRIWHKLCPEFYNSAFRNEFRAVPKPKKCTELRPVSKRPVDLQMGYFNDVDSDIIGDLFALATKTYPYNVVNESFNKI